MISLTQKQLNTVRHILTEYVPDSEVRAFGSRVDGKMKSYSDLDLAIIGTHPIDGDVMRLLREAFQESDLPFRIDVLDWNAISDSFKRVIEKKNVVLQQRVILK